MKVSGMAFAHLHCFPIAVKAESISCERDSRGKDRQYESHRIFDLKLP